VSTATAEPQKGSGWIVFAGVMLFIAGTLGVIDGVAAITDSKFYVRHPHFIFGTLHVWGWITLVIGALLIAAVFGIWARAQWARWFGVAVAAVSAVARLLFVPAYPLWSLALFAIDLLIIYGLATYGSRPPPPGGSPTASEPPR
jgi:hypothetical protein